VSQAISGNHHVAEWFGHRAYPVVAGTPNALRDQVNGRCPFLSDVTRRDTGCIKAANSKGVCTVSSVHRRRGRQDWLVCPIRALDLDLVEDVVVRLFGYPPDSDVNVVPAPVLNDHAR
jgi:hypothetical protein